MKKIEVGTIARTIVLGIALANQVLTSAGKNPLPFGENEIYEVVTGGFTIVASLIAWWKNNSFTQAAIAADETMREMKEVKTL